jgi:AAA+ ATPase superfamily predicted ATPase
MHELNDNKEPIMKIITKLIDYFPVTLAKEESFCNRVAERQELLSNILKCKHTVLASPRRYGKTSLVYQVITENNIPCAKIDLFMAVDDASICKFITDAVEQAIKQIIPFSTQVSNKILKIFHAFDVSVKLGNKEYGLSFKKQISTQQMNEIYVAYIYEALKSLSELAKLEQKTIVVFIDEFQEIIAGDSCNAIMGAIRNVAQESEFLAFIFSGSKRHLLSTLFNENRKPLYMMCSNLTLERIKVKEYREHLNSLATKRWGKSLDIECIKSIMRYTDAHAYYVNLLCSALWEQENLPTVDIINNLWSLCVKHEKSRIIDELNTLTHSQKDVLKGIALYPTVKPTGIEFTKNLKRPVSTINQSVKSLLEKDMIYKIENEDPELPYMKNGFYWVLDPMIKYIIISSYF